MLALRVEDSTNIVPDSEPEELAALAVVSEDIRHVLCRDVPKIFSGEPSDLPQACPVERKYRSHVAIHAIYALSTLGAVAVGHKAA
ncbi:hypothetical protein TRAPUB_6724 [Trametes pubescens]|uniref:Uncharacterized protein n=1 Tax=Trametes pubescens TaxID=154538 RepID=A0A1M2V537_TRAPU|nr:hypothetical protein TRAPUB_6724 [Trametes pubescens]